MADEQETLGKARGNWKKIVGSTIFSQGIVVIILNLIWLNVQRNGYWWGNINLCCHAGVIIGGILTGTGILLLVYGKHQEIIQRNILNKDASQWDYWREIYANAYMKKNAGIMLLAIGITGIIMGLLIFCVSCGFMPNMDTPEDFGTLFAGVISGLVSFPLAIIGAIFYSGGKRQLNEQNNYTPDSNKEITEKRSNRLALASLITGILGIISIPLMFYGLPEIFSILAIVFGIAGLKRAKRLDNIGDGSAIVGMTIGIVDFILQVVYVIVMYSTMAPILKPF